MTILHIKVIYDFFFTHNSPYKEAENYYDHLIKIEIAG